MQCKACSKNFSSMKSLQKHQENSCFRNISKKTGENRTQVDRLVFDDPDDEPEEHLVAEAWKQTAISSQSEKIKQLLAHRHQLKQQRTDIQNCLADVKNELMLNNVPAYDYSFTTRTANTLRISRDKDSYGTNSQPSRIKNLREEYLKHGGQHPDVLEQMRNMEIEAKLKGDKEETHKVLMKNNKLYEGQRATQEQQSSHKETNKSSKESIGNQSHALMQQILRLESENQHLQSQLNTFLLQIPQTTDDQSLKVINKKHQHELLLLQQKIEIVKKQKELNQHEKELEEIIGSHIQKPVQQFISTPNLTSNRYILPSRTEMDDLYIHCDFISGLPPDITQCHVILHLFSENSMLTMEGIPISPVTCTLKSNPYQTMRKYSASQEGFAFIGKKQPIPSYLHCPNLCLVVEIQVHRNTTAAAAQSSAEYFQTQAWTKISILNVHLQPVIGKFFVPLKVLPIIAKMSKSQFDTLPQFWKAEFYYQIYSKNMVPDPLEIINKSLYTPAYQGPEYPTLRHKPPPPPPTCAPNIEEYSVQHPAITADLSKVNFSVVIYWVKGAKPVNGKLILTAFHPKEEKVVECLSGPVTIETDYVETSFRYGYHMFGDLRASFQDVDVHKDVIILAKFYQQEKHENIKVKNMLKSFTLKESLVAWTAVSLLKNSRQDFVTGCTFHAVLNTGPHTLKLYCPPIPNLSCILDSEANQQWTKYGNAILHMDIFSGTEHTSRKSPNYDMEIESNQELVGNDLKASMADSGFDIYIDGCRFLPDSVSYTRIAGRIIDRNYKKYGGDISAVAKINSDIFNPVYEHKEEFREPDPPVSATLLLKVYSKNAEQNGLIVVGFAAINIFVELGTNRQPMVSHSGVQVSLNEGAFQLRLYWQGPDYDFPMTASYFTEHEICPIPCATILVRICKVPKDDMGNILSCNQISKEEWKECGVWEEAPNYSDGMYISTSCIPTSSEMQMFPDLLARPIQTVSNVVKLSPNTSVNKKLKNSVTNMTKYIKNQLIKGLDEIAVNLDLNKISKYQPEWGIKVAVDGASNLPWSGFTLAHICLNPPALFYKKILPYSVDKLKFVENIDLEQSTNASPVWKDGFKSFPSRTFNPYLTVIIHLREIHAKLTPKETYKFSLLEEAWTVIQVFTEQYAVTESFQLPLFQGPPPAEIIDQLNSQPCQKCIKENILKDKIINLDNASVFVRLCDARRSDELPTSVYNHQKIPINRSYLALRGQGQYHAKENPGQPISSLVPAHKKPEQFLQAIADNFKKLVHKYYKDQNEEDLEM